MNIKKKNKYIACVLAIMIAITMHPISAYADTADETSKVINAVNSGEAINNTDNFYMIGANWGGKKILKLNNTDAAKIEEYVKYGKTVGKDMRYEFPDAPLKKVNDTKANPFRKIARLNLDKDEENFCTGSFIGEKVMLTAAHCVGKSEVNKDTGKHERSIGRIKSIVPAQQCGDASDKCRPFGTVTDTDVWTSYSWYMNQDYWNNGNTNSDWALVVFDNNVLTDNTGYFGIKWNPNLANLPVLGNIKVGDKVRISGYSKGGDFDGSEMSTSTGKILSMSEYEDPNGNSDFYFIYRTSMFGGASGAGVEIYDGKSAGLIMGVNTQERCTNMLDDKSCPVGNQFNRGMMFSHNDFNHISSVIDGKYQEIYI